MEHTNPILPDTPQATTPASEPPPSPLVPAAPDAAPPPGMLDMERVRYWAGRGSRRRLRPATALM
jgi:hypothetical protein